MIKTLDSGPIDRAREMLAKENGGSEIIVRDSDGAIFVRQSMAEAVIARMLSSPSPEAAPGKERGQIPIDWMDIQTRITNFVRIEDDSEEWEGPSPHITGKKQATDAIAELIEAHGGKVTRP